MPLEPPTILVGSLHTSTMGYGYGARVPTARNQPTLPASIPQYRYPPVSERSSEAFKSTILDLEGDKARKKHCEQLQYQSSGDYGRYLCAHLSNGNRSTASSSGATGTRPSSGASDSLIPVESSRPDTALARQSPSSSQTPSPSPSPPSAARAASSLHSCSRIIDSASFSFERDFGKHSRYDMTASRLPSRGCNDAVNAAANTRIMNEQSRPWSRNLRRFSGASSPPSSSHSPSSSVSGNVHPAN